MIKYHWGFMNNKLLTFFDRSNVVEKADVWEQIGNIGLGLLRIGFGKIVTVEKISNYSDKITFTDNVYSTSIRVVAVALFILAFPLTIPLTCIGCIAITFSKSHQEIFSSYIQPALQAEKIPPVLQERKIPPVSKWDTIINEKSAHGSGEIFSDSEIVEKLPIIRKRELGSGLFAFYTKQGKSIIQQQATRGCTAAVVAMLIMDNGKQPNLKALTTRNLGTEEDQKRDIREAGLEVIVGSAKDLSELRNLIIQNNSCIVSVQGSLGGHVIIVDEVSKDLSTIRLRDPYHGWEITVNKEAFLKEWHGGKTFHIATC